MSPDNLSPPTLHLHTIHEIFPCHGHISSRLGVVAHLGHALLSHPALCQPVLLTLAAQHIYIIYIYMAPITISINTLWNHSDGWREEQLPPSCTDPRTHSPAVGSAPGLRGRNQHSERPSKGRDVAAKLGSAQSPRQLQVSRSEG